MFESTMCITEALSLKFAIGASHSFDYFTTSYLATYVLVPEP